MELARDSVEIEHVCSGYRILELGRPQSTKTLVKSIAFSDKECSIIQAISDLNVVDVRL